MNINISETIRKMMGWCPNAEMQLKREGIYMDSYGVIVINKIKGMGFNGFVSILHLVYALWLVSTALRVLANVQIFPWYVMDIIFISSGILLLIGITSLVMFFNFVKSAQIQRILALSNIVLTLAFFWYLGQTLISGESQITVFDKPFNSYAFGIISLIIFTTILAVPNIMALFSKPVEEKNTRFIAAVVLAFIVSLASLGVYYVYLGNQREVLLIEEMSGDAGYRLYGLDPNVIDTSVFGPFGYQYFLDSNSGTTGHPITSGAYEAIQFLQGEESGSVLGWWDYELDIKASGKEPVIAYASEEIKWSVGRPSELYDTFESNEKVMDVSRFFTATSEEAARDIAGKYGARYVYISRNRWDVYFTIMYMTAWPDFRVGEVGGFQSEAFIEKYYEPSVAYKFNTGAEMEYFEKIFENEDVLIYELK